MKTSLESEGITSLPPFTFWMVKGIECEPPSFSLKKSSMKFPGKVIFLNRWSEGLMAEIDQCLAVSQKLRGKKKQFDICVTLSDVY